MILTTTVATAPTEEPVTIDEFKEFARLDGDHDDAVIAKTLKVSRLWCEEATRRAFCAQTLDTTFDHFDYDLWLPRPTLKSVTSVKYWDADGAQQTASSSLYDVDLGSFFTPGRVVLAQAQSWPITRARRFARVIVRHVAGEAAADVDERIKMAVSMMAAHMYENRELIVTGTIVAGIPSGFSSLLRQLTVRRFQ